MAHWDKQAKRWALIGAPLKPSHVDIQNSSTWIQNLTSYEKPFYVLVLGVTPELINMTWPKQTVLIAIDSHLSMIESILPKNNSIKPLAIAADWLQLPLVDTSIDLVIGDGCYSSLEKKDYARLNQEVQRILKHTGTFIMRFFSRPEQNESLATLQNAITTQTIGNFNAFKLRLAMALHEDLSAGVCLKNIWNCWSKYFKKIVYHYKQSLDWTDEMISTIDNYKHTDVVYTFPTLSEIRSLVSHDFYEQEIFTPNYHLGTCCPTLKFIPKVQKAHAI